MDFNGAVLVSNSKIQKALDNWDCGYDSIMKPLRVRAEGLYPTLSWWQRFWYDSDYNDKGVYYLKKTLGYSTTFCWGFIEERCYYDLGWVTKDEYNKWLISYKFDLKARETVRPLREMVKAGEPIYLTPLQAEFVNNYCGEVNK